MARALIALGSNLGDRPATLDAAVAALDRLPQTRLVAKSTWIESAPLGPPSQPAFLNGVALVETRLEPLDLLDRLHGIENAAGRVRTLRWGPRTLDLDLLLYEDLVCQDGRLTLPHPRMALRRFVLQPAVQVAAQMVHPTTRMTIGELLARFSSTPPYLAIMGPPGAGKTRLAGEVARRSGCRLLLDAVAGERAGQIEAPNDANAHAPAKSAFPPLDREIEFLARRSRIVAVDDQRTGRATVSDFWLAQSLAWSEAEQGVGLASRVEVAYQRFAARSVSARFVVVLNVGSCPTERVPPGKFDERLRAAMRALARRTGQPPAIWLTADDWEGSVAELLAALAG
ncbi:MAG TPA: 2-amino-4-hydroxy-6-hydroxymethyldihydropteridine diphosphokinase [Pirellulales bacterium]|jgi:2-amino-4-hydroxy-6-hydroxymethyldihydropteridine diphosphokinase|nr:2-amino-4-hydroxy-6-hydroxymethyldihydropteridine diphosphokinase [Pirellulales bacterium]